MLSQRFLVSLFAELAALPPASQRPDKFRGSAESFLAHLPAKNISVYPDCPEGLKLRFPSFADLVNRLLAARWNSRVGR